MKNCVQCGIDLEDYANFCTQCGAKQPHSQEENNDKIKKCIQCGYELDNCMKFCPECGAKYNSTSPINNKVEVLSNISTNLSDNYYNLITNYLKDNKIISKRIKIGNPFVQSSFVYAMHRFWYGQNQNENTILLYADESIYEQGLSCVMLGKEYLNICLLGTEKSINLSDIGKVLLNNDIIIINDEYSLDFLMLNSNEICFLFNLIKIIESFNIKYKLCKEFKKVESQNFENKRRKFSIPLLLFNDMKDIIAEKVHGGLDDRIITNPSTHKEQVTNAIKNICPRESTENIILILDDTILNSFKAGIVLTNDKIYLKPAFSDIHDVILLKDLKTIEVRRKTFILNHTEYIFNLDKPVMPVGCLLDRIIKMMSSPNGKP